MKVKSESEVAQLCPTLHDCMDCSPPGFSIHGVFQARVLEWGAITFSVQGENVFQFNGCSHNLQWFWSPRRQSLSLFPLFPLICHEVMGLDIMILVFRMLSYKPTFSLSSFTFIKKLSAIRVVSSAYLRLLIFLPAVLIPACASSRPTFLMMYSAYKLNKQGDNIQP